MNILPRGISTIHSRRSRVFTYCLRGKHTGHAPSCKSPD
ncbi:unnamed protein product, partial [Larinioides sclopetarius]